MDGELLLQLLVVLLELSVYILLLFVFGLPVVQSLLLDPGYLLFLSADLAPELLDQCLGVSVQLFYLGLDSDILLEVLVFLVVV